jgi:hypothetical protein
MRKLSPIFVLMLVSLFTGCAVKSTNRIEAFDAKVLAAPDVHGANRYMQDGESEWRANVNVQVGKDESYALDGYSTVEEGCYFAGCGSKKVGKNGPMEANLRISPFDIDGSIERLAKSGHLLTNFGLGYSRGLILRMGVGGNYEHFEFGGNLGAWILASEITYSGTEYSCEKKGLIDDEEYFMRTSHFESDETLINPTVDFGAYTSAFFGPAFLTYSFNAYVYRLMVEEMDGLKKEKNAEKPSLVATQYLTLGVHLFNRMELHGGVAHIFGDFDGYHIAGTAGISFYM